MKNKFVLFTILLGFLFGGCVQNKSNTNKIVLHTGYNLNIEKLSSWDKGILQSVINSNNTGLCSKVKHITVEQCNQLYNQQKLYLKQYNCDKVVFEKQLCLDKLHLKQGKCDNIVNKSLKVQCVYEKNLQKALSKGNSDFCKTLPRSLKLDCERKFKKYGQR